MTMYIKADYNGSLVFETVAGFRDESLVLNESEFLRELARLTERGDELFGIVSNEVYDVLNAAYPVSY